MIDSSLSISGYQGTLKSAIPVAVLRLDSSRFVLDCCERFVQEFGEGIVGAKFDDIVARGDRKAHADYLYQLTTYDGRAIDLFAAIQVGARNQLSRIRMLQAGGGDWHVFVEPIYKDDSLWHLLEVKQRIRSLFTSVGDGIACVDRN